MLSFGNDTAILEFLRLMGFGLTEQPTGLRCRTAGTIMPQGHCCQLAKLLDATQAGAATTFNPLQQRL
jgi:hypothetical protein